MFSEKVHIVNHPLVSHKLTIMRDKNTSVKDFRELVSEIGMLITYEATRDLPLTTKHIKTPICEMDAPTLAGKKFDAANGGVNKYSSDVMVPAFLAAYTNMGSQMSIFPTLAHLLPNWSIKYSGLSKLPWFRDVFKSFNINHAYKSIYAIGSYSSYSTFMEYMNGLGFVSDVSTGNPVPSSMYNISTVSINEAFSPLLGIDMTFNNNLTCKLEYRTTRVLSLSMTSIQINEATSHDWVVGMGYKINNFKLFGGRRRRKVKSSRSNDENNNNSTSNSSRSTGFNA